VSFTEGEAAAGSAAETGAIAEGGAEAVGTGGAEAQPAQIAHAASETSDSKRVMRRSGLD
jgi:hypothetical protein